MKLQLSRWILVSVAGAVILFAVGKLALDFYFAIPESPLNALVPDELHDPRTTAELEAMRFPALNEDDVQRQCEALLQESGRMTGESLSEILAAGHGGQESEVKEAFRAFRATQADQYSQKTKDPESIRPAANELLKLWAGIDVNSPDPSVLSQIGTMAQEAVAAGSSDPLISLLALRYQSEPLDESAQKQLAELPEQLTAAGYSSMFRLMTQVYRFVNLKPDDAMNRRLLVKEVIKDFVRYSDEFSSDKRLDRINWFNLYNLAQLFNVDERELLYRRLMISELTSPYLLHMAAGNYYQAKASNTRGGNFASEVATDAWPAIERDYSAASLHFRRAWLLRPDLPHAAGGMSSIANVNPRDEHWSPRDWFELACRAEFDFLPVYSSMKNALLPRWGGSHEEMIEFGIECAATKAFETPVPYMLTEIIMQIDKETSGGTTWENPEYLKILNDFWTELDTWATENKIDRKSPRLYYQISFNAALRIRNQKYAEAKAILDTVEGDVSTVPMLPIITDPDLAVSSVYALADPGSEALIEIEKRFGSSLPRDATAEELDEAIKVFAAAGADCQVPRAKLYLAAREHSLTLQKKFLTGDWVDLQFDPELTHWRIQDSVATVESPTSLHLSNLTQGDSVQLAIPRVSFSPPYELHVTVERIRGQKNIDRPAVNVGSISEAIVLGEPGGITFVIDDEPRIAGTYLPNGVQPETYYLLGLKDKARLGLQIWSGHYLYFVNHFVIPLRPVSQFRAGSQLSLGGNVWEVDTGEIRISDVRIRKMQAPSPPTIDASSEEKIEYLTQVVANEPDNLLSRLQLADLLIEQQSMAEAMTHFEVVYEMSPEIARTHGALGLVRLENGREEEALQLLLSSLDFNPSDHALYGVAWIHATAANESLRNGSKALEIASELCDKTQNQDWIYLAAKAAALAELKRFPEAIAILESTTQSVPPEQLSLMQSMLAEFQKNQPWRGKATE